MFSTVDDIQHCRGCSVLWRMFSTVEGVHFCGGGSVLWRVFSTVEDVHYCSGRREGGDISTIERQHSALWGLLSVLLEIPTVNQILLKTEEGYNEWGGGDNISTVEDVQYCGRITAVLWRVFSTMGE